MPISGCRTAEKKIVLFLRKTEQLKKKIALSIEEIRRRKKRTKYNKGECPAYYTGPSV